MLFKCIIRGSLLIRVLICLCQIQVYILNVTTKVFLHICQTNYMYIRCTVPEYYFVLAKFLLLSEPKHTHKRYPSEKDVLAFDVLDISFT